MPTVSFYLRNEDYDKWRAVEKPGEFIHNALNSKENPQREIESQELMKPIKAQEDIIEAITSESVLRKAAEASIKDQEELITKAHKLCKHGADPAMCKHAKFINGKKVCK